MTQTKASTSVTATAMLNAFMVAAVGFRWVTCEVVKDDWPFSLFSSAFNKGFLSASGPLGLHRLDVD